MNAKILPSNVDDPRFSGSATEPNINWDGPDDGLEWPQRIVEALLEALPRVVSGLMHH